VSRANVPARRAFRSLSDASRHRSQHGDLGKILELAIAVLEQPTNIAQTPQRPPRTDKVLIDGRCVAVDDVVKVLGVSECQRGEVKQGVALCCLGPVDEAGDLIVLDTGPRRRRALDRRRSSRTRRRRAGSRAHCARRPPRPSRWHDRGRAQRTSPVSRACGGGRFAIVRTVIGYLFHGPKTVVR
jgi:hypothetical protein